MENYKKKLSRISKFIQKYLHSESLTLEPFKYILIKQQIYATRLSTAVNSGCRQT